MKSLDTNSEYHIVKRESVFLGVIGLIVAFIIAVFFMGIGFIGIGSNSYSWCQMIFGLVGIGLFILFMRGGWMMASGPYIHILSITEDQFIWGRLGKEKMLAISEIQSFYWHEFDRDLTFRINAKDGKSYRIISIENIVSLKNRPKFKAYLKNVHSKIPVSGNFEADYLEGYSDIPYSH